MLPVEILSIQETIVLRARGSELLILPHHVKKLKDLTKPRDFSQYFRDEALVNRPARKLFEAWLRKDPTVWTRLYQAVQKGPDASAEGDDAAPAKVERKAEKKAEKAEAKADKAEAKAEKRADKTEAKAEKKADKTEKAEAKPEKKADKAEAKPEKKADKPDKKADKPDKKADKPEKKADAKAEKPKAKTTAKKK